MKIIKIVMEVIYIILEDFIKEDDIEQDFRRNYSERYSYSNNVIRKFL